MRVLFLISTMGPGGAERVMAHLIAYLSSGHKVRLMTWEAFGTPSFFSLPQSVEVIQLGLLGSGGIARRLRSLLSRFSKTCRQIKEFQPDVVVSFMDTTNMIAIAACLTTGVPVVISERIDPYQHRIGFCKTLIRRFTYPLADCCVVQTQRIRQYFERPPSPNLAVIPNPVTISEREARPASANAQGRFRIIAVGRLEWQKGLDRLLDAFTLIASSYPNWDLVIFGEGSARKDMENKIERFGLSERVRLPGVTADPEGEFAASHIMVLPSRYEGFPNALAEALATGLPAVGFCGVSGVDELIIDNETGFLVNPKMDTGLSETLKRLMDRADLRSILGARARCHMKKWRSEIVYKQWESLLAGIARN